MSKKLEDYGSQKSTSISTARRLAEFLGDQMVKDSGLACQFFISKFPVGAPVTERAIPLAIFQAEESVRKYYLRRWTKDRGLSDFDIRKLIDWEYYLERFSSTIQKIITIPAALQDIQNPVPRIKHPEWLHKQLLQRNDSFKQHKMTDHFKLGKNRQTTDEYNAAQKENTPPDIEDCAKPSAPRKRTREEEEDLIVGRTWKEALGEMPVWGSTHAQRQKWFKFQKLKWQFQRKKRKIMHRTGKVNRGVPTGGAGETGGTLGAIRKRAKTVLDQFWNVIQINPLGNGDFRIWAYIGTELHAMHVAVPRIFYVNRKSPKSKEVGPVWKRVQKILPRSTPANYLYQYSIAESDFRAHYIDIQSELNGPEIEGVYEMGVPLEFRLMLQLGCVCSVNRSAARKMSKMGTDHFELDDLEYHACSEQPYLAESIRTMYLYHVGSGNTQLFALFVNNKMFLYLLAPSRQNLLPNVSKLYRKYLEDHQDELEVQDVPRDVQLDEVKVETNMKEIQKAFSKTFNQEKKGPIMFCYQTAESACPIRVEDCPVVALPRLPPDELAGRTTDWQKAAAELFVQR